MNSNLPRTILFTLIVALAAPLMAQQAEVEPPAQATIPEPVSATMIDSREIRSEFTELLRMSPPELGTILALDPTLLSNDAFLAQYPALARFTEQYPEVRRNPRFYLAHVSIPGDRTPQSEMVSRIVETLTIVAVIVSLSLVFIWLVRTTIEQRRWSRMSRLQSEVHNKILDRFGSNDEVLRYMDTKAGRRFLESAPIPVQAGEDRVSAPINRVLWSIQIGLVVGAGSIGIMFVSSRFAESAEPLYALGVIGLAVGIGFIASGFASMALSRRFGLWKPEELTDPNELSSLDRPTS